MESKKHQTERPRCQDCGLLVDAGAQQLIEKYKLGSWASCLCTTCIVNKVKRRTLNARREEKATAVQKTIPSMVGPEGKELVSRTLAASTLKLVRANDANPLIETGLLASPNNLQQERKVYIERASLATFVRRLTSGELKERLTELPNILQCHFEDPEVLKQLATALENGAFN